VTDFVLDASVALRWCLKNEATEAADRVLERLADTSVVTVCRDTDDTRPAASRRSGDTRKW